jgi:hypothetical protein
LHRYAVEKINHNQEVLAGTRLSAQIEWIPPGDSFHASRRGNLSSFQEKLSFQLPGEVIFPASRRVNLPATRRGNLQASRRGNLSSFQGEVITPASRRGNHSSFQERYAFQLKKGGNLSCSKERQSFQL